MLYDVLVVGGAGVDTIVRVPALPLPLADSYFVPPIKDYVAHTGNGVALGLHHLGVRTKFVDFLGDDEQARAILDAYARQGLDFSHAVSPTGTPRSVNLVDPFGRRLSLYDGRHPADLRLPRDLWLPLAEQSRHVHLSITNVNRDMFDDLERLGRSVSTDLHDWDGVADHHREYAYRADLVFLSAANLTDRSTVIADIFARGRAQVVIATDGGDGSYLVERGGAERHHPAAPLPGPMVDSNGAGDAFVSGFLARWLAGAPFDECQYAGSVAGAFACVTEGTHSAFLTARELSAAFAGTRPRPAS
jgi:sugar/nucleoside kinase (ribokinase family)